ncbi:Hypothetical_protein [Hexamita inflata]|uniref:Hypothetical_protein n=1 Tax=Hexamita inflata TaxID=28002 RepID=A0AA86NDA4_9EUKA|nr:Hypothetical protein HINF_LOCUS5287 [Hexamita inflata]
MASVGTPCEESSFCKSKACYVCEKAPNEKRCAITQLTCSATQMSVYVSTSSLTCKKRGGQACLSLTDTTCAYGCFQKQYYDTFRCALSTLTCNPGLYAAIVNNTGQLKCLQATYTICSDNSVCFSDCLIELLSNTKQCTPGYKDCSKFVPARIPALLGQKLVCVYTDGSLCTLDTECGQKCYPATASTTGSDGLISARKCSSRVVDCSKISGTTEAVNLANKAICALNDGQTCPTQGISLECFNERCMQIEHDRTKLKCITLTSVSTCDACDKLTQVCVADANNNGVCRQANGQTKCDNDSCANTCMVSRANENICSIPCESSCLNTCYSESSGLKPICSKKPGETCDITIEGQCDYACLEVDSYNPLQSLRNYACSDKAPSCKTTEIPVVDSTSSTAGEIKCVSNNGRICTQDSDCDSTLCYPVSNTNEKRCASSAETCSDSSLVPGITVNGVTLGQKCFKNVGTSCTAQGNDAECLSGICAQVKDDIKTLKCISTVSINTCSTCNAKQICVIDQNNIGTCLLINGQTGCTDSCVPTKQNVPTCSINCDIAIDKFCQGSLQRCRTEIKGLEPTCKSDPGDLCSTQNSLCEFKCIQQIGLSDFRCSTAQPDCSSTPKTVPRVSQAGVLSCVPNNGELCTTKDDCHSKNCIKVAQSTESRCSANTKSCTTGNTVSLVGSDLQCKKNAGQACTTEGADLSCFSGVCAQIQGDQTVFKCITFGSVSTCTTCDQSTTKCAVNSNDEGVCLLKNGQIIPGGTDCKSSCANLCIVSKLNVQTCSIKCKASCDQTKCRSDITGLLPTCFAEVGEVCVPENNICVYECLETLDENNKRTDKYACSKADSDCSAIQVAVISLSNGNIGCQPNHGSICDENAGCASNICYPVVQSFDQKCAAQTIDCKNSPEPKIQALDLNMNSVCIKVIGEPCENDSDCFTNSCYYTDTNNGKKKCAVQETCESSQIPIYKNKTTSICLKKGGEDCSTTDECAYGCFSYRPGPSLSSTKCAGAYEPACDPNGHIGVIKSTDNSMKCYLIQKKIVRQNLKKSVSLSV